MSGPCKSCPDRTLEPNCHHPDRCEKWKKHEEQRQKVYAERAMYMNETSIPRLKYDKHGGHSGYYSGSRDDTASCKKKRGHTFLRGDS